MNWQREAASRLPTLLESWLRSGVDVVHEMDGTSQAGLAVRAGERLFLVEVKASDDIATLERAKDHLRRFGEERHGIPMVTVPYMSPKARAWAEEHRVSWADLSGNADIRSEGLCISVSGEKNRYTSSGRPSNPFTARYSRVGRALLAQADRWWKQVDIGDEVGLPSGTVSKVVQRLDVLELLERNERDEIRARKPSLLLDSWVQRYRFDDHALRRYHIASRSGEEALRSLAERFTEQQLKYAATGLSAAWLLTAFAGFRLNTFFVDQHPRKPETLGLRPVEGGENVWLVVPRDDGVFYGMVEQGAWCAHPVQVYLDLLSHHERAADAARELRVQRLTWRA